MLPRWVGKEQWEEVQCVLASVVTLPHQFSFISPLKTGELGISVTKVVPGLYSDLMNDLLTP